MPVEESRYSAIVADLAFSPDGYNLFVGMRHRWIRRFDSRTGKLLASRRYGEFQFFRLAVSPDGKEMAYSLRRPSFGARSDGDPRTEIVDAESLELKHVLPGWIGGIAWSPKALRPCCRARS